VSRKLAFSLIALACVAALGVMTGPSPLGVVGGLVLAFGLPGAGLTAILFRARTTLTASERFTLVPALSLATLVLGGMVAWAAGLTLSRNTWLAVSFGVAMVGLLAALVWPATGDPAAPAPGAPAAQDRGVRLPTNSDPTLVLPVDLDRKGATAEEEKGIGHRLTRVVLPLALVVALLGGASWLSLTSSQNTHNVEVISLSAVPPGPRNAAGDRIVRVSAAGLPAGSTTFSIVVIDQAGIENARRQVTAGDDGTWTADLTLPGDERMTVGLYRHGETAPFRTVIIANAN